MQLAGIRGTGSPVCANTASEGSLYVAHARHVRIRHWLAPGSTIRCTTNYFVSNSELDPANLCTYLEVRPKPLSDSCTAPATLAY